MQSNHDRAPLHKLSRRSLAVASALTLAASGVVTSEASARKSPDNVRQKALAGVIAGLEQGKFAEATKKPMLMAVGDGIAEVQPLVFPVMKDGQEVSYFAYSRKGEPNFNLTPSETAARMVIEPVQFANDDDKMPLTRVHLDKNGLLINGDDSAVTVQIQAASTTAQQ